MRSDEDLMTGAARGDMSAFELIVQRYQALVWRMAVRFVGNSEEAQDITQNVFLKLFQSAKRYEVSALFKTYLFRIVNTTCIDHIRKKRLVPLDESLEIHDGAPSASDKMSIRERDAMVRQTIESLPLRQRAAITLRYDVELPIRDIAEILRISEKAVERLLAHARDTLYLRLEHLGVGAGDF